MSDEGWLDFAVQLELAGAAALELNFYLLPTDFAVSGSDIERRYVDIVRRVKRTVRIPVSVKLPPFFSALGNFSKQLESAGADGLVFFNQLFRPDLDIDTQTVTAEPVLSTPIEIYVPLTWIALLSPRLKLSLAAAGGVDSYVQVVKFLLAGADVVATTSALLRHGPQHMTALIEGLQRWLADHAFESVSEIRGHLHGTRAEPIDACLRRQYAHSLGKHEAPSTSKMTLLRSLHITLAVLTAHGVVDETHIVAIDRSIGSRRIHSGSGAAAAPTSRAAQASEPALGPKGAVACGLPGRSAALVLG